VAENLEKALEGRTHAEKASIRADVEKFTDFLAKMPKMDVSGIGMFSCSGRDFFETVGVLTPFRPQLIVSRRPAIAPLVAILEDYKRIAVCIVDRRSAVLYEYFMGRMEEVTAFRDDVPGRVKVAGWAGWQESNIARSIEHQEMVHLKNAAEVLFERFRLGGFEWLFLGVRPELREALESVLHTYVRERLKGHIDALITTPQEEIRLKTMALAEKLKDEDNVRMVQRLVETAGASGPAVVGLQRVLEALNRSAVSTLVLRAGTVHKGVLCVDCGLLGIKRSDCSLCGENMDMYDNIIDAVEEAAMAQGASIRHINADSPLDKHEGIGAFTRFAIKNGA
jgi:peptide subunit release factor 1 (eRF1)